MSVAYGTHAIEASGLEKSFGNVKVLRGVDVRVERGSLFALLGPNGAGKTTMVRILATLTRADAGQARIDAFDVVRQRQQVRRRISLTGQYAAVDELQTGEENLRMVGQFVGLSRAQATQRARALLEQFDLADVRTRRVGTYSGGMRRRLDLAASLVGSPSVIFLDEPTTGLDPRSRQAMWSVIRGLVAEGVTVFLTTQYLDEADQLADRIAVLDEGRVVAEGTASDLKRRVASQRLDLTFPDARAYDDTALALGSRVIHRDTDALTLGIATDGSAAQVRAQLDELDPQKRLVSRFAIHDATLDDVFFTLTGHGAEKSQKTEQAAKAEKEAARA